MEILRRIAKYFDLFNEYIGKGIRWFSLVLVLLVCLDVGTRYLLNSSSVAVQELQWHLFAALFLLASGYTLQKDKHVRVDVLYQLFSKRGKAWINLLGSIIFLIPFSILIIVTSFPYVYDSYHILESSPDPGGLPFRYLLKSCIPLSFIALFLQGLSLIVSSLRTVLQKKDSEIQHA